MMLIGGITDACISVLFLLIFFLFLSLYHRARAEQFSGDSHAEDGAGLRMVEERAMAVMVGSIYLPLDFVLTCNFQRREAFGVAAFQLVRVTLLLIPVRTCDSITS